LRVGRASRGKEWAKYAQHGDSGRQLVTRSGADRRTEVIIPPYRWADHVAAPKISARNSFEEEENAGAVLISDPLGTGRECRPATVRDQKITHGRNSTTRWLS
jgi:hypothetical protein